MMLLAECISAKPLPDRCQPHSVIHVTCMIVQKVCPAMRAKMRAGIMREGIRVGIMREGMRAGRNEGGSQIKTKSLI